MGGVKEDKEPVSRLTLSKSALFLSPCVYWVGSKAYDDRYADTTERDKGTRFHRKIDQWLKKSQKETQKP